MPRSTALFAAALLVVPALLGAADPLYDRAKTSFAPLPAQPAADPAKVALGRQLFFETRLSKTNKMSCNSCHGLASFGVDNQPTSVGHDGRRGGRNSPTVLNAGLHVAQFWDGRAKDLTAQAKGPVLNPIEMGMPDAKGVEAKLRVIPGYQTGFKKAFPGKGEAVTFDHAAEAIAAFEGTLLTRSKFDKYLEGDKAALTPTAKRGLKTFMDRGCVACHGGVVVGGGMYQKFGAVKPYQHAKDLGRFEVTKLEADKYVFKVPSLRNITKTGPYFHDGRIASLPKAVEIMGETQLGVKLGKAEVADIVAFMDALRGDPPVDAKAPKLP